MVLIAPPNNSISGLKKVYNTRGRTKLATAGGENVSSVVEQNKQACGVASGGRGKKVAWAEKMAVAHQKENNRVAKFKQNNKAPVTVAREFNLKTSTMQRDPRENGVATQGSRSLSAQPKSGSLTERGTIREDISSMRSIMKMETVPEHRARPGRSANASGSSSPPSGSMTARAPFQRMTLASSVGLKPSRSQSTLFSSTAARGPSGVTADGGAAAADEFQADASSLASILGSTDGPSDAGFAQPAAVTGIRRGTMAGRLEANAAKRESLFNGPMRVCIKGKASREQQQAQQRAARRETCNVMQRERQRETISGLGFGSTTPRQAIKPLPRVASMTGSVASTCATAASATPNGTILPPSQTSLGYNGNGLSGFRSTEQAMSTPSRAGSVVSDGTKRKCLPGTEDGNTVDVRHVMLATGSAISSMGHAAVASSSNKMSGIAAPGPVGANTTQVTTPQSHQAKLARIAMVTATSQSQKQQSSSGGIDSLRVPAYRGGRGGAVAPGSAFKAPKALSGDSHYNRLDVELILIEEQRICNEISPMCAGGDTSGPDFEDVCPRDQAKNGMAKFLQKMDEGDELSANQFSNGMVPWGPPCDFGEVDRVEIASQLPVEVGIASPVAMRLE